MQIFKGVVVSSGKMDKTIKVAVTRVVKHPVYHKRYKRVKNFLVHDETGAQIGDNVSFVATKPISKMKRWKVVREEGKKMTKKAGTQGTQKKKRNKLKEDKK